MKLFFFNGHRYPAAVCCLILFLTMHIRWWMIEFRVGKGLWKWPRELCWTHKKENTEHLPGRSKNSTTARMFSFSTCQQQQIPMKHCVCSSRKGRPMFVVSVQPAEKFQSICFFFFFIIIMLVDVSLYHIAHIGKSPIQRWPTLAEEDKYDFTLCKFFVRKLNFS